jgi:hypothetical protein
MKVYIFDWRGTLDQVDDPVALITRLRAEGHRVFVTSSFLPPEGNKSVNASEGFLRKGCGVSNTIEEFQDYGVESTLPLIFVDDEPWYLTDYLELLSMRGYTASTVTIQDFLETL